MFHKIVLKALFFLDIEYEQDLGHSSHWLQNQFPLYQAEVKLQDTEFGSAHLDSTIYIYTKNTLPNNLNCSVLA